MEHIKLLEKWLPFCLIDLFETTHSIDIYINKKKFGYYVKSTKLWGKQKISWKDCTFNELTNIIINDLIFNKIY